RVWLMPKRPPKAWWTSCVNGVRSHGGAIDPARVCGAVWSRKSDREKRFLAKLAEARKGRRSRTKRSKKLYLSQKAMRLRKLLAEVGKATTPKAPRADRAAE